jgi:hypothetical protein
VTIEEFQWLLETRLQSGVPLPWKDEVKLFHLAFGEPTQKQNPEGCHCRVVHTCGAYS